jgi:hypothetical protein
MITKNFGITLTNRSKVLSKEAKRPGKRFENKKNQKLIKLVFGFQNRLQIKSRGNSRTAV